MYYVFKSLGRGKSSPGGGGGKGPPTPLSDVLPLFPAQGVEMSVELTETKRSLAESVEVLNRVPTPPLEGRVEVAVAGMCVQEAVRSLEDTLSQKQWTRAVQLLRSLRWAVGR